MGDELARVALFGDCALAGRNACAIDEQTLHPMGGAGACQRGVDRGFIGHVGGEKGPADFGGDLLAALFLKIQDRDLDALRREHARCGLAEPRGRACDDGRHACIQFHTAFPSGSVVASPALRPATSQ